MSTQMQVSPGRPDASEYAPYYHKYISRVPDGPITEILEQQIGSTAAFLRGLSEEQASSRPAPDKWSVKQIIGHLCDSERVFAYRALCFARGDRNALPSFEQDDYVREAGSDERSLAELVAEFELVRRSSIELFRSFKPDTLQRRGIASSNPVSVRGLMYITAGHEIHHYDLLKQRFGKS